MEHEPRDLSPSPTSPSASGPLRDDEGSPGCRNVVVGDPRCPEPDATSGSDTVDPTRSLDLGLHAGTTPSAARGSSGRRWLDRDAIMVLSPTPEGPTTATRLIASFAETSDWHPRSSAPVTGMLGSLAYDALVEDTALAAQRQMLQAIDVAVPLSTVANEAAAALRLLELQDAWATISPPVTDYAAGIAEMLWLVDSPATTVALSAGHDLTATAADMASQPDAPAWAVASIIQDMHPLATCAESALATLFDHMGLPDAWSLSVDDLGAAAWNNAVGDVARYGTCEMEFAGFDPDASHYLAGVAEVLSHGLNLARYAAELATVPPLSAGLTELWGSETLRGVDLGLDLAGVAEFATIPLLWAGLAELWTSETLRVPSIWDWPVTFPPELVPGSPEGDFLLIQDVRADQDERLAALRRVAERMAWVGFRPGIRPALLRRAHERQVSASRVLRDELAAAMVLVLGSDSLPQTVRLGPDWVTDEQGKVIAFPPEQLGAWSYRDWFTAAVVRTVRRSLLDWPDVLPVGQGRPIEEREGRVVPLAVGEEDDLLGPEADDPLTLLVVESDHDKACRRLAAVFDLATPCQRQILGLLARGLKNAEIAGKMGITPGAVRAQLTFLRRRARDAGLAA